MTHSDLFDYLREHCRDEANVTPLRVIAASLGTTTRKVQELLEECHGIDGDWVVCSVTGGKRGHGLYVTMDPGQMLGMVQQLDNRQARCGKRRDAILRKHPALRKLMLRKPPRTARPTPEAVRAQTTLFDGAA